MKAFSAFIPVLNRPTLTSAAGLALAGLVTASMAQATPLGANMELDASTCAALGAASARGGGQFPLGRAACGLQGAPASTPAPATAHAQQLQLYLPAAEVAAAAAADKPPAATHVLPGVTAPVPQASPVHRPAPAGAASRQRTQVSPAKSHQSWPRALVRAVALAPDFDRVAERNAIDPLLLHAIARIESRHNPEAVSHAGARGLMQVMPATGARFGVASAGELHDALVNLDVSARYLRVLKQRFPGDLRLVLAAYNAGEGAVERHGRRVPPYAETQAYVVKVLDEYALLRTAAGRLP